MYMPRIPNFLWKGFSNTAFYSNKAKPEKKYYGLNKAERKNIKKRVKAAHENLDKTHLYKESFKIDDKHQLSKILINSEIYNEGGLIALNKPFGVQRYKEKKEEESKKVITTINSAGYTSLVSIEETLPLLEAHYGKKNMEILLTPERFTSGILLLSSNQKVSERVRKAFRRSLGLQKPHQTYLTLVHGKPVPETGLEKVASYSSHVPQIGKVTLIKRTYSKNEVKNDLVSTNIVEHAVLDYHPENDVSLVEVNALHTRHHFIRVWLAECCSPVLGDRLFGGRIRMVNGKRILISPQNYSSYEPPDISVNLLKKLNLPVTQAEIIPPHIHFAKLAINGFRRDKDLVFKAPLPEYFRWSCDRLSLQADEQREQEEIVDGIEIVGDNLDNPDNLDNIDGFEIVGDDHEEFNLK